MKKKIEDYAKQFIWEEGKKICRQFSFFFQTHVKKPFLFFWHFYFPYRAIPLFQISEIVVSIFFQNRGFLKGGGANNSWIIESKRTDTLPCLILLSFFIRSELGAFEWWISELRLNPLFFLICRLTQSCKIILKVYEKR